MRGKRGEYVHLASDTTNFLHVSSSKTHPHISARRENDTYSVRRYVIQQHKRESIHLDLLATRQKKKSPLLSALITCIALIDSAGQKDNWAKVAKRVCLGPKKLAIDLAPSRRKQKSRQQQAHAKPTFFIVHANQPMVMAPPRLLVNKVAIVTGGTTGIGRAIALAFLRHGCSVTVNHLDLDRDKPHLASLLAEAERLGAEGPDPAGVRPGRLAHLPGDIRDAQTSARLVEFAVQHGGTGRLDICVSNAGICTFAEFLDMDHHLFADTVRTNLDGAFYVVQAAARHMARAQHPPGGSVIGISSISALVGGAGQTHYTPTKAGILSLMQSTACALGKYGIRCNALLPGTVKTQLNEGDLANDDKRKYMEGRIPLGRTGVPEDVAGPAVFLACDELSGYVTGAQLLIDGGLFVNLQ